MNQRRNLLMALGASFAANTLAQTTSSPSQSPKGPIVWRDMDQSALDNSYDQSVYAPNIKQVQSRYASNSDITRSRLGNPIRLAYGPTPIEALDVYLCKRPKAPIQIFIHGGAWRAGLAKNFGFKAETFVNAGAHFVVPDFINVIESNGDLMPMIDQVRRSIAWVYKNAHTFNGDPNQIYLSSHSSGAHLAGVALTTDWAKLGLPKDIMKGGVLCSGMYDLQPVRLSARSSYVKFTDEIENALSSQRHLHLLNTPIIVAHGDMETPEFQRQSKDFTKAVNDAGKPFKYILGKGYNHFEMPETYANPYGILGKATLEQMQLA